ncbi:MAG: aminotransferase class V-fold PLP-dependent enzyme [Bacteroidetes bacterium]|nr:aminotransferase class V-fold PLP-dependent enzyme [Bacteroidota bacterium]
MIALQSANEQHAISYGADDITFRTRKLFSELFEAEVEVLFVFNGTGANVLSMSAATQSFHSVLCADTSHVYMDESSAPETFTGCRFIPIATNQNGQLESKAIARHIIRKGDIHFAQPRLLSITQSTEYGTVYSLSHLQEISQLAHKHDLYVHMDGSRFFNAAANLNCSIKEMSTDLGLDILSLGGTKMGLMYGEAVVVFNKKLTENIFFKQKQSMQLASKTRFIAAQFEALLSNNLWEKTATHANKMAQKLVQELKGFKQITITKPVEANAVFAIFPLAWISQLQHYFPFYVWNAETNEVRLMCAWDTKPDDVKDFIAMIQALENSHVQ